MRKHESASLAFVSRLSSLVSLTPSLLLSLKVDLVFVGGQGGLAGEAAEALEVKRKEEREAFSLSLSRDLPVLNPLSPFSILR